MKDLKERRTQMELSQTAMAVKVGVSLNTYINWETGVTNPNEENEKKLIAALMNDDELREAE